MTFPSEWQCAANPTCPAAPSYPTLPMIILWCHGCLPSSHPDSVCFMIASYEAPETDIPYSLAEDGHFCVLLNYGGKRTSLLHVFALVAIHLLAKTNSSRTVLNLVFTIRSHFMSGNFLKIYTKSSSGI